MRVEWSDEFDDVLTQAEQLAEEGDKTRLVLLAALLGVLRELQAEPVEESASLKLVRQARRHRLWRVAHAFHADAAVRIVCWFTPSEVAVIALVAFDKVRHADEFYVSAAVRAEAMVDRWLRENT